MGICSFGRDLCLWLWSAVLGLWWEPCLLGFADLVGSSGPRLVGRVYGDLPREPCGDLQLWSAVMGLVLVGMGICSFGRQ